MKQKRHKNCLKKQKEQYSLGLSSRVEWNVTQMKNGSDIQPEDSFLTLPVFLSSINQLKVPQWSSVWQWRGIYHSQIKARSSSTFAFTLGWEFMRTGGIVSAAYLVTQQSAKGCTTRQSIVCTLSISTLRMSFRRQTNGALQSFATMQRNLQQRHTWCNCSVQQFSQQCNS